MGLHFLKKIINKSSISTIRAIQSSKNYSLYTPDYLETLKPKIPLCPVINIQIKGYDYPILENYQRHIDRFATNMDIDVDNTYALPAKKLKVTRLRPFTSVTEVEYILDVYERNMQLSHIPSSRLPILIRVLEATLPEGVTLNIQVWNPIDEERRYVPDKALLDLKDQLADMKKK